MSEPPASPEEPPAGPLGAAEAGAVRAELELIVQHPFFEHSKRYPALLRYVVEHTLDGRQAELKERTVGIDALGRPPSYDTAQDPVVRTTAAEVRKRLAQYYQETGSHRVRISLPVGSYIPQFDWLDLAAAHAGQGRDSARQPSAARRPSVAWRTAAILAVLCVALATVAYFLRASRPRAIDQFWGPILSAKGTVAVCIGAVTGVTEQTGGSVVTIDATTTASRLIGILQLRAKPFEVRQAESVDFGDIRAQPIITIGGFNNKWTLRLTGSLRFRFEGSTVGDHHIADSTRPGTVWTVQRDRTVEPPKVLEDYAIVARLRDPSSGQHVLVVAGIQRYGTSAAGEFVTGPEHMERLAAAAPSGWETKNIELVIATKLVDGVTGPPRVVAAHYWD